MKTYLEIIPESIQCIKMTDAEYFSSKYKDYVSNSKLGLINPEQGGSVEKYNKGFSEGFNASFELGSAVHGEMLQPGEFVIADIYKPTAKLGLFAEEVYKFRQEGNTIEDSINLARESADYYQKGFTANRRSNAIKKSLGFYLQRMKYVEDPIKVPLFLSEKDAIKFHECVKSIKGDKEMMSYLEPEGLLEDPEIYNEYAILCEVKVTREGEPDQILKVKAKIDNFTIDHEMQIVNLNDLKTTGRPVAWFMGQKVDKGPDVGHIWMDGSFEKYHYYRQSAFYMWLLQSYLNESCKGYTFRTNFLVVETNPEYKCKVIKVPNKWVQEGLKESKELLILVANEQKG